MRNILLFDLDQNILNRNESLIRFICWQVNFFQLVPQELKDAFIKKFIELDDNGNVWKDIVYSQLIKDFNIKNLLLMNYLILTLLISINFQLVLMTSKKSFQIFIKRDIRLG